MRFITSMIAGVVAALRADADAEVLLLRLLVRREAGAHAGDVDGDRLLGEDVLAGVDGGREVERAEAGRRGEHHQVDVRREHLLVRVEAGEALVVLDLVALREFGVFAISASICLRDCASRSGTRSPIAISSMPGAHCMFWMMPRVPRPPQPIRPTLIVSEPCAYA